MNNNNNNNNSNNNKRGNPWSGLADRELKKTNNNNNNDNKGVVYIELDLFKDIVMEAMGKFIAKILPPKLNYEQPVQLRIIDGLNNTDTTLEYINYGLMYNDLLGFLNHLQDQVDLENDTNDNPSEEAMQIAFTLDMYLQTISQLVDYIVPHKNTGFKSSTAKKLNPLYALEKLPRDDKDKEKEKIEEKK